MNETNDRYQCPCCNQHTLEEDEENSYEICSVCGWKRESVKPGDISGANGVTLELAKACWAKYGKYLTHEVKKAATKEWSDF